MNNMVGDIAQKSGWPDGSPQKIALHGMVGLIEAKLGGTNAAAGLAAGMGVEAMSPILSDYLLNNGYSNDPNNKEALKEYNDMMNLGSTLIGAAAGAVVGGSKQSAGAGGNIGLTLDVNNRQLHPKETELIKNNAARFAKEMYGTDNPTQDQVAAATSVLANTAQNLVDNNLGYDVPYSEKAEAFLHTLQAEYAAANPNLSIGNGQYLFYATPEQKSSPYINSGTVDKGIADSIIKTPVGTPSNGNIFSENNPYNPINPCISAECIPQGRPGSGFDYVSFQGNVYVASGGFTVNLHDGTVYGSFGLSRNYPAYSIIPSLSLTAGSIIGGGSAKSTNDFLQGAGLWAGGYVPTPIPFVNAGGGISQGYGGRTASELGISTSPGAGVAPINYGFKPQKVSEK
jgi:filamentous hemagglutinin